MKTLRVDFRHFWPAFEPEHFLRGFSYLAPRVELVHDALRPELLVVSTFEDGLRASAPPVVDEGLPRLFYTAENVRPDFAACEWALSFCRDIDDARHLRLPNYVFAQHVLGFASDALLRAPDEDPRALLAKKTRFCTFLQSNSVPFRNEFVRRLSQVQHVDCAGPCLNNTGFTVPRTEKHAYLAESKFVIAFENEATPGYVTEKIADGFLSRSVPVYWGDPTVERDFEPAAFLDLSRCSGMEELIERMLELDRDDERYLAMLAAPPYAGNRLPEQADPERIADFFERVADEVAAPRSFASAAPRTQTTDEQPQPASRSYVPGALGFHGDQHLLRLVHRLLPAADLFLETGTNVGTTLGWVARTFPHLPCLSCEPDARAVAVARGHACTRADVEVFDGTSQEFLRSLTGRPALFERTPLVWLDAHGYGFEWPLREEVRFVFERFERGFLMIDDFRVPGREQLFGYDAYDGQACAIEYIESAIPEDAEYDLYFPAYTEHTSAHHPLRGWALFVFGPAPRVDLERELPSLVRRFVPERVATRLGAAEAAYREGDVAHATSLVRHVLADAPGWSRAWNDLAACALAQGQAGTAFDALRSALELDPHDATALANLLDLCDSHVRSLLAREDELSGRRESAARSSAS